MGECRVQEVAAAMVGLPGGVVADVVGASAFFGGNWKFYRISVYAEYPPYPEAPDLPSLQPES